MSVKIVGWSPGRCSLYAVVRNGICLADQFLDELERFDIKQAQQLAAFIANLTNSDRIRQALLRPELPNIGVYAMYNHKNANGPYNPSRLLCAYVGKGDRTLLVGSGFIKTKDQPIQANAQAINEAKFLGGLVKELNSRIDTSEITIEGSQLHPTNATSFIFQ